MLIPSLLRTSGSEEEEMRIVPYVHCLLWWGVGGEVKRWGLVVSAAVISFEPDSSVVGQCHPIRFLPLEYFRPVLVNLVFMITLRRRKM